MTSLPAKVTASEIIVCADRHEVGRVLETLSLAQSITAKAISIDTGATSEKGPGRLVCAICGNPAVKTLRDGRLSVRLGRGWVS